VDSQVRAQEWHRLAEQDMKQAMENLKAIRNFVINLVPAIV